MPISEDVINGIKRRNSIVAAIEATGLTFRDKPLARWLQCIEHSSLWVNTHNNTFRWYSRPGWEGDIFDWLMKTQGVNWLTAVNMAAQGDYGPLAPPSVNPSPPPPVVELPPDLHLRYHKALDAPARAWWAARGLGDEWVSRYFLGVCDYHEIWMQPTYTIPVIVAGKLVNIRHRLAHPPQTGDKYRPERSGLPVELFNSDILTPDLQGVIVVAGEVKVMALARFGLPAVSSTAGCGHWHDEWTTRLQFCRKVYVAFDPGEGEAAGRLAERIGERAWLVDVPEKPDDYLLGLAQAQNDNVAREAFRDLLRHARPHVNADIWQKRNGGSQWGRMRNLPK